MSTGNQRVECVEQFLDVVEVQAGGRLVEDEQRGHSLLLTEVIGQFDALVLAARKGGGGLPQFDVAQAHILQGFHLFHYFHLLVCCEELNSLIDSHVHYVISIDTLELHLQDVALETLAVTGFTFQHEVVHKLHLHGHRTLAFALLAAASLGVEREVSRSVAHLFGQLLSGQQFANLVPGTDVRHGVRAGGSADGVLIDEIDMLDLIHVALQT